MKNFKTTPLANATLRIGKQRGFTITELMLVLGVAAVIIAAAFFGYKTVTDNNTDQRNLVGTTNLLTSVKNKWQGIGSYTAVTNTKVNDAGLVVKPFSWISPNIKNVYDQIVTFTGTASDFNAAITVPESNCPDIVGGLDGVAYKITHTADATVIKSPTVLLSAWNGSCGTATAGMVTIKAYVK